MNTAEYRIREYCGEYRIEIRAYEEKGMLWWKRKEWSWCRTNPWGGVRFGYPVSQPYSKTFKSLEKARAQIAKWKAGVHYYAES